MKQEDNYYSKYQRYREFWQNNIQGIEDIIGIIEKQLFQLERQYSDFDSAYDEIVSQIDILSSIHSCFNTMSGKEYILKLKSLLKEYKKNILMMELILMLYTTSIQK